MLLFWANRAKPMIRFFEEYIDPIFFLGEETESSSDETINPSRLGCNEFLWNYLDMLMDI